MPKPLNYRDLDVWKRSMDLVVDVYTITREFPRSELYSLTDQIRRAASSVPSNIAEGNGRRYRREYTHHVSIARGSGAEVETQLAVAVALEFIDADELVSLSSQLDRLSKMLFGLYRSLAA